VSAVYSSNALHAQHKRILGQVPRVAQAVLLPELSEQILHAAHARVVVGEVALKEGVDAAAHDEPHDGAQIASAKAGSYPRDTQVGEAEDGEHTAREHAEQLKRVPFVGEVAHNLGFDREVGCRLPGQESKIAGRHGGC
jgi:hypothetical protein